jgi:uncharacterized protein (TIGR02246 family)
METEEIEKLHSELLTSWNKQDAKGIASLFLDNGNLIGFDGSQINGQNQIETELTQIFANHKTARYVWKVKEVRLLNSEVALLRAIVGMVPPGKKDINPATNAIQSLIAVKLNNNWKISLFQNTPAQFHGRPELVEEMTKELSELL